MSYTHKTLQLIDFLLYFSTSINKFIANIPCINSRLTVLAFFISNNFNHSFNFALCLNFIPCKPWPLDGRNSRKKPGPDFINFSAHQPITRASREATAPKIAVQDVCNNLCLLLATYYPYLQSSSHTHTHGHLHSYSSHHTPHSDISYSPT